MRACESIYNVNDEPNLSIPKGNCTAVNGWVLELFGRITENGEKITWNNCSIKIKDADLKKVNKVVLKKCTIQ
ncbi:MAG: hypothetical protein LE168_00975 [Endomicrobium sp.]|nr:hypothetical protein [Endomicrobium sp.]